MNTSINYCLISPVLSCSRSDMGNVKCKWDDFLTPGHTEVTFFKEIPTFQMRIQVNQLKRGRPYGLN